jgi:hypothetical protein
MKALLERFVAAIDAEIELLERDGRDRAFELRSGERASGPEGQGGVYIFLLPDPLRLPEDSTGLLAITEGEFPCVVTAQEGNRLWILIETAEVLPPVIPSGRLRLASTDLLKRLRDTLSESNSEFGLAPKVFGVEDAEVGWGQLPPQSNLGDGAESTRQALEQALGSEVTFLWGPPGTGKTFSIAQLVAAIVASGDRVLITSHTHAAVEQALWAAVEPPSEGREGGPLHDSPLVASGGLLKVGPLRQQKIPPSCHLDSRLEALKQERQAEIDSLASALQQTRSELAKVNQELTPWLQFDKAKQNLKEFTSREEQARAALNNAVVARKSAESRIQASRRALETAEASFILGRRRREEAARVDVGLKLSELELAESEANAAEVALAAANEESATCSEAYEAARRETDGLRPFTALDEIKGSLEVRGKTLSKQIDEITLNLDEVANELLDNAQGLFATLTKLYADPRLKDREWDVVIIDEVSMAMPPLVAFAAMRARKRVVLVGDFYQLPPIVQSRDGIAHDELGTDVFEKRQIPIAVESGRGHAQLAKLSSQRRMAREIADIARELAYGNNLKDHPSVVLRQKPEWVRLREERSPLVVVDLAELRAWAGKLPGTLSRFNFYSGLAAVELASVYASQLPSPETSEAPPIGIITPYSAQRRYIARLVNEFGLDRWVVSGTVHTFQGNECDVIVFDSVLAEPHWTARLTNPHEFQSVRRDLNVAVTRARHQLVFVGDGRWLDKHAKAGSALGLLWARLRSGAKIVPVNEALGPGLRHRVAAAGVAGWSLDVAPKAATLLDESTFYPALRADLHGAQHRLIMFTPYIGKTRWPQVEPMVVDAAERGVEVFILHRPLEDRVWQEGDPAFGRTVFDSLRASGVRLVPFAGIHAKTIVVDSKVVYEGSLNWASHVDTYEHMWRFESPDLAALVERMLQLRNIVNAFGLEDANTRACPHCDGPLYVINQREKGANFANQAIALACANQAHDKSLCKGYIRGIDQRAPFRSVPACERGTDMWLYYTKQTGRPWEWRCEHR